MLPTADLLPSEVRPELEQPRLRPKRSPVAKAAMMWTRRLHLYFGLFLFPWAVLYGVTAFLFNHPAAFSDAKTGAFTKADAAGTSLADFPDPETLARQVFAELEKRKPNGANWKLVQPQDSFWMKEFAFATADGDDGRPISLLFNVWTGGGTVRVNKPVEKKREEEPAPFAVGMPVVKGKGKGKPAAPKQKPMAAGDGIKLSPSLPERLKASAPTVLERLGYKASNVVVTSTPVLEFHIDVDGRQWHAMYDPMTGSVSGSLSDEPANEMTLRNFLLRLHLSHGYPSRWDARWFWAVIVDLMAFIMCFWGVSGLLMWWQIKATRFAGIWTIAASAIAAVALVVGMHQLLTG